MAKEVVRQHLPMLAEGGRGAATDDAAGRDRHYLPDTPEGTPTRPATAPAPAAGRPSSTAGC